MAIIYTYNTAIPESDDILLGTERSPTLRNPTKNFKISEIAKFIIDSTNGTNLTVPLFFDVADPITGVVSTTLTDSILKQNANPGGTTLTVTGNISITGTVGDSTGKTGLNTQVLSSTGVGTSWVNAETGTTGIFPFVANTNPFTITIVHNGNQGDFPSVTVVTAANKVVFGEIDYLNITTLTVTFSAAFSGTVYTN
tara:strand:+ start:25 stop:615 length:591 start_codon:yes stop_codon:yes gene_type:complete